MTALVIPSPFSVNLDHWCVGLMLAHYHHEQHPWLQEQSLRHVIELPVAVLNLLLLLCAPPGITPIHQKHVGKIMVVDFDVHHGDGTESVFYDDKTVLFCSVHRDDMFPFGEKGKKHEAMGSGDGLGFNVNVNLEHELKDGDLLAVFDFLFLPLANQFNPEFVLVSAGYDAAINDPLGQSKVSPRCYRELVFKLKSILNGKIVLVLEGGYDLTSLSESCAESLRALLDGGTENMAPTYDDADTKTWNEIGRIYSKFKHIWPILEGMNLPKDVT